MESREHKKQRMLKNKYSCMEKENKIYVTREKPYQLKIMEKLKEKKNNVPD